VRAPDFGGGYWQPRHQVDDGRNSIAMPIRAGEQILGCLNLTWRMSALTESRWPTATWPTCGPPVRSVERKVTGVR
jgi:IclR family mhp operon transcriptional activator